LMQTSQSGHPMSSLWDSSVFLVSATFLITVCAVFVALICVEKFRRRTRKKDVAEEIRHIRAEFEAIVDGLIQKPSDQ
jgi:heme/copper-type cytochrome/quinol oxidase subunit 2